MSDEDSFYFFQMYGQPFQSASMYYYSYSGCGLQPIVVKMYPFSLTHGVRFPEIAISIVGIQ